MNEQMNEQQSEETLSLAVEVSDEALEAAGAGTGSAGAPTWETSPTTCSGC